MCVCVCVERETQREIKFKYAFSIKENGVLFRELVAQSCIIQLIQKVWQVLQ